MLVLGIETSCDETGVAVYDSDRGLLAHTLYSQVKLHAEYGGVVPELASRDHVRKILPMLEKVLDEANISKADLDGIAYTAGPGLMGALNGRRFCRHSDGLHPENTCTGCASYGRPSVGTDA